MLSLSISFVPSQLLLLPFHPLVFFPYHHHLSLFLCPPFTLFLFLFLVCAAFSTLCLFVASAFCFVLVWVFSLSHFFLMSFIFVAVHGQKVCLSRGGYLHNIQVIMMNYTMQLTLQFMLII